MGCGVSRFYLHDDDWPLQRKPDELPKKDALLKDGEKEDEISNKTPKKGIIRKPSNIDDDDDNEVETAGRKIDRWGGSSPSFREYCVDCKSEDGLIKDDEYVDGRENKTNNADGKITSSNEERAIAEKKRGKRFIKVFTMQRPSSVRNFFNVTTCYNANVNSCLTSNCPTAKSTEDNYQRLNLREKEREEGSNFSS